MVKQKRLQKRIALALSLLLLAGSLAGCGGKPQEDASGVEGPTNTYTPPVNEDGYIVVTMPITLNGGNTAEELEAEHKKAIANMSEEEIKQLFYSDITANEDGSFNYILTPEQYLNFKRDCTGWGVCMTHILLKSHRTMNPL